MALMGVSPLRVTAAVTLTATGWAWMAFTSAPTGRRLSR